MSLMDIIRNIFCGDYRTKLNECNVSRDVLRNRAEECEGTLSACADERTRLLREIVELRKSSTMKPLSKIMGPSSDVYRGEYSTRTKDKLYTVAFPRIQDYFSDNSLIDGVLDKAGLTESDTPLMALNKILGVVQENCRYEYDSNQYGRAERFSLPFEVWMTRKDDCESTTMLVVAAWERMNKTRKKFPDSDCFLGMGYLYGKYGHGFVVFTEDVNSTSLDNYYIGESTLSSSTPAEPLSNQKVQDNYWVNWGLGNHYHSCRVLPDNEWWYLGKETAYPRSKSESHTRDKSEFDEKKRVIDDLWGEIKADKEVKETEAGE